MQKYSKLLVVLPCHSLEDFPIHHRGEEAADLLANWTALWHPALIASCCAQPDWHQADNPECSYDGNADDLLLALVPCVAQSSLDSELLTNLDALDAIVIESDAASLKTRSEIVEDALNANAHAAELAKKVDSEIAEDFHALGYAFLQIQIMTRQLRYSSNLDRALFSELTAGAAKHAIDGEHEKAKSELTKCFDMLLQEKSSYYPVEAELIDIVLTAETTLGKSLRRQLGQAHAFNVLITGTNAQKLSTKQPESLKQLKTRVNLQSDGSPDSENESLEKVGLIGGLQDELPESLVSTESLINQLHRGRTTIQNLFGIVPSVFMRRRFGLSPATPGVLEQFDFTGAIHATLDDGEYPSCSGANLRWTGNDDRSILAFGETPLSAADEGSFVGLGVKLGEAIDSAHIASVVFCHWPDKTCQSFKDILRTTKYGPLFGSFVNVEDYFESVYDPGYGDTFTSDEYRDPYLKQAVQREALNPVSCVTKYWKRFYRLNSARALWTQTCATTGVDSATVAEIQNQLGELQNSIESALNLNTVDDSIDQAIEDLIERLTNRRSGSQSNPSSSDTATAQSNSASNSNSIELINTTSLRRRVIFQRDSNNVGTIKNQPPIIVAEGTKHGSHWVAEVPPMGAATVSAGSLVQEDSFKSDPAVAEELVLRNEFFELNVDPTTGGIRSVQIYGSRINLVSQQLAIRIPSQKDSRDQALTKARYTKMVANQIETVSDSRLSGTIVSSGQLLDGSEPLANFKQSVSLSRGKRIASVSVEIELLSELSGSLNHYVCSRLAWKSEASRLIANTQETRDEITSDWFTATNFVEIVQDDHRLVMLTGGLPYHRRASRRMMDSLLIVGNETQRSFAFGIGVDVGHSMAAAVDWLSPVICVESESHGDSNTHENDGSVVTANKSGWLFHFNCKNILVTWWQPCFNGESGKDDQWSGVQLRLRETEGRAGTLSIRCPQPIASGERVNFGGDFLQSLKVAQDDDTKLELEFGRFDYLQISIHWKK